MSLKNQICDACFLGIEGSQPSFLPSTDNKVCNSGHCVSFMQNSLSTVHMLPSLRSVVKFIVLRPSSSRDAIWIPDTCSG